MAIMYPNRPHEFSPASREGAMFEALEKLPDDYYVFHSFKIINVLDECLYESETDFVVFNPKKGILCIEAKAGRPSYDKGIWKYGSGIVMSHGGPYRQAAQSKWNLRDYIIGSNCEHILSRCKLLHAVWFPSVGKEYFIGKDLPSEADMQLTLTADSIDNIEEDISKVFDIELRNGIETRLSNNDVKTLIERVLAPSFELISLADMKVDNQKYVFKKMLTEQVALLNYLEEQNTAIINGLAGTGKTVMAIEKSKKHADQGEPVLFLCYNSYLKEYLQQTYAHENIFYYTIDGLACKLCDTAIADYDMLKDTLENMYLENTFPYKHVVIDEGQDFGRERLNDISIIELLQSNVLDGDEKGTFYLFYDKNQMVQARELPPYIDNADCKLTLYRNCRNTENIAITSLRLLGSEKQPKLFKGALIGDSPEMYFADNIEQTVKAVNFIIDQAWEAGYESIQILTTKTEASSIIAGECSTGVYTYKTKKIPFTTCRKYKGLEADVVIMVDLDEYTFNEQSEYVLYVGSSRARYKLHLISNVTEEGCKSLLEKFSGRKTRKPWKAFAAMYNAKYIDM